MPTTTRALCATLLPKTGDLWFSPDPADRERAKTICHRCPLQPDCATAGIADPTTRGVWGGLSTRDRGNLRGEADAPDPDDQTDDMPVRRPCGTRGAFLAHRHYDETCEQCETAHAARIEAQRRARLDEQHTAGGTDAGHRLHRVLGETPCAACHNAALRVRAATKARAREEGKRAWAARAGGDVPGRQEPAQAAA